MKRSSLVLATLAVTSMAVAMPDFADARAGGGSSMGSRGSMTYSAPPATRTAPYSSQPMQRSMTQPGSPSYGSGYGAPGFQPRSSFTSGLLGGLIGAGIGGMLFGHGFFGGGGLGMGGFFGFLLQIFLLVMVVRFVMRWFANRRPAMAGGAPNIFARGAQGGGQAGPMPGGGGGGAQPPSAQIGPGDYQQFEQLLQGIQAAWSNHDLAALQAMATPEMVSYFSEQLTDQSSRGVRNVVSDVRLVSGDLAQAWSEQGRDYATVAMRFSMVDVTRDASGRVVDGDPNEHITATEIWTFIRSRGGHWILSAIQQAR
jgi:predicted lipid-binding transport protein (Tim44 family)